MSRKNSIIFTKAKTILTSGKGKIGENYISLAIISEGDFRRRYMKE